MRRIVSSASRRSMVDELSREGIGAGQKAAWRARTHTIVRDERRR